jgi:hypothetical protein
VHVTVTVVSVEPPAVVISLAAKRVLPLQPERMFTRVSSAVLKASTRFASACICSRVGGE